MMSETNQRYSEFDKDSFLDAVESLKKYRRADLIDDKGRNLLDVLYTDLLPNDHILKKCLRENTTFLIGRKGTGKSTIFLKMERELRKKRSYLPCYIDVKTVFESSQTQSINLDYLKDHLNSDALSKYLIERTFIQNILLEITNEINRKSTSFFGKIAKKLIRDKSDLVKQNLINLRQRIEDNEFLKEIEIPIFQQRAVTNRDSNQNTAQKSLKIGSFEVSSTIKLGSIKTKLKSDTGLELSKSNIISVETENEFSEILLKVFQIKDIITEIKDILKTIEIKHLFVLLDDLSEIEDDSIKTFIDTIIAPLNNWSEEFIKFKVAVYPNRIHYGKIDPGKIDTINLDFYNLYSEFDRNKMEESAIEFTKRLIEKRIKHYTGKNPEHYFDTSKVEIGEYYELLFQVSMNVPRIIGYILSYCHQNRLIFDRPITKNDIEVASQKYYQDKIKPFFFTTTYSLLSMDEKISILQLKELIEILIGRLNDIKKRIQVKDLKGSIYIPNHPFTSHFHFDPRMEKFLSTLELNYFISKYSEQSDKDGKQSSVYCINYGLAMDNNLLWGKPKGTLYRKYFIERPFNFNKYIEEFLKNSKKIHCINPECNKVFDISDLPFIEFNNNKCNSCSYPVIVESISDSILEEINEIDSTKLLPIQEMKILYELSKMDDYKLARDIAEELDYHSNLVARRGKILDEREKLIERKKDTKPYKYRITKKAKEIYFKD